ncbi:MULTISPECIES: DUF1104 domain-containing protein [Arcobacter]|jgi:hypothetical protein|uniref:DUF1104 domain-containing protein n=1 Tax=Arcobacter ellisii TaxID=913109 RepID=A0A347U923_9BACT|nr:MULTISPECIES: DUF1104 domain-containing protein [Arcobacter]AXX95351.1 hypothetical protein AELL_1698 [Arcobacter ellisii]MDY3205363.1 DUF1104 domain-containing protein [Arcobacter sp.]RXI29522.1 DUF1104 domain-containing protein [Arcobacter ellisii]
MEKIALIIFLLFSFVFAEENYSEMSTQELIEIIGYVKEENQQSFLKELNSRIPKMSEYEKAQYEKRLSGDITQEEQIEDEK